MEAKVKHFHSRSGRALACNRQFRFIYHLFEWRSDLLNPLRILSSQLDDDSVFVQIKNTFLKIAKYICLNF